MRKNESVRDRIVRSILGFSFLIIGFFWSSGAYQILAYIVGLYFTLTAFLGNCFVYLGIGYSTYDKVQEETAKLKRKQIIIGIVLFVIVLSIISHYWTKYVFVSDLEDLSGHYKKTLLSASAEQRIDASRNYELLLQAYINFEDKYRNYRPLVIKWDETFSQSLDDIDQTIVGVKDKIKYGNLTSGYYDLERIRPIINDILRRNGLLTDKVALVDFYETLDLLEDAANEKNPDLMISYYQIADIKLKDVELFFGEDDDVKLMRAHLDAIYTLSSRGELDKLSAKVSELKSSYTRAYLKLI